MSREDIEEYNLILAEEIAAVETYQLALQCVQAQYLRQALLKCRDEHSRRVDKLRNSVVNLDGIPASAGSGVWGPLAEFVLKNAASETDAIAILEQSEVERLVQYEAMQKIVVSPVLKVLRYDFLWAQHELLRTLSTLLNSLLLIRGLGEEQAQLQHEESPLYSPRIPGHTTVHSTQLT